MITKKIYVFVGNKAPLFAMSPMIFISETILTFDFIIFLFYFN